MREKYFPEVVQAIVGGEHTIYVYFSDGKIVLYDVGHLINRGGVFEALKDEKFFTERLTVLNGTAAWDLSGNYDPAAFAVFSCSCAEAVFSACASSDSSSSITACISRKSR